jgi:DNA mismatch repair ATPase MutL
MKCAREMFEEFKKLEEAVDIKIDCYQGYGNIIDIRLKYSDSEKQIMYVNGRVVTMNGAIFIESLTILKKAIQQQIKELHWND